MGEKSIANIAFEPARVGYKTAVWLGSLPLKTTKQLLHVSYEFGRGIVDGATEDPGSCYYTETAENPKLGAGPVTGSGRFRRQSGNAKREGRPQLKLVQDRLSQPHD